MTEFVDILAPSRYSSKNDNFLEKIVENSGIVDIFHHFSFRSNENFNHILSSSKSSQGRPWKATAQQVQRLP